MLIVRYGICLTCEVVKFCGHTTLYCSNYKIIIMYFSFDNNHACWLSFRMSPVQVVWNIELILRPLSLCVSVCLSVCVCVYVFVCQCVCVYVFVSMWKPVEKVTHVFIGTLAICLYWPFCFVSVTIDDNDMFVNYALLVILQGNNEYFRFNSGLGATSGKVLSPLVSSGPVKGSAGDGLRPGTKYVCKFDIYFAIECKHIEDNSRAATSVFMLLHFGISGSDFN